MAVEGEVEVSGLASFASRICCIFAFSFLLRGSLSALHARFCRKS